MKIRSPIVEWLNGSEKGKRMYPGQTPAQSKFAHHKTVMDCLGLGPQSLTCFINAKFKVFSFHRSAIFGRTLLSGTFLGFGLLSLW